MRKNWLLLLVAVLMGGIAAYLAHDLVKVQAATPPRALTHIVVATEPLAYGSALTGENVNEIEWFAAEIPPGAFATKDELFAAGRRTVLSALQAGEPVLRSKISGPGQRASLATMLEDGKRAVTVRVDDVRGVAGFVLPGDFVDIVMIADDPANKRQSYSDVLLEHLKVLAIDQVAGDPEGKPTVAKAVTVEVSKDQAQKLLLATNIGKLSLMLAQPTGADQGDNHRVSERDLGRVIPQPVRPAPPEPKPVAAPPPPSDKVKVTIVQNGEAKEYSVIRGDAATRTASPNNTVETNPAPAVVSTSRKGMSRTERASRN
jgi:pilus assembly protein CpaB